MKWKKRKRDTNLGTKNKRRQQEDDEDYEEEEEDEEVEDLDDEDSPVPVSDPVVREVLSAAGSQISDFPIVVKRTVNRPHSSVLALVAAERAITDRQSNAQNPNLMENISHGQLQALSVLPRGSPALASPDPDPSSSNSAAFLCIPPTIMEGKGIVKRFASETLHVVPMHSDWFSPTTVHRLERQVVPHFFSGKSNDHTPERYMELRNRIVAKYVGNPGKRLSVADCQALAVGFEIHELSRIVRFLDHWGIINYSAEAHRGPRIGGPLLREDVNGEIHIPSTSLRSIDSLIHFDRPKSRFRPEDLSSSLSSSIQSGVGVLDLDSRIRERLSEHRCNFCARTLPHMYYQSHKEVDIILCSDCFHDGKFVTGHTSIDFVRVDSAKDLYDLDGDTWTDQETLLLLEALEIYNENWNEIAEHVATKSKAQCILHFVRLPMENGLLEHIELPSGGVSSDASKEDDCEKPYSNMNGDSAGVCPQDLDSENRLPFANSGNPVMALVAFLASAVGPRVAAACAHASLAALSKEDPQLAATSSSVQIESSVHGDRMSSESMHREGGSHGAITSLGSKNEEVAAPLSPESVKVAAKFGLSAAATKAKLFADHEEREIQRLTAGIINHQLKRLELKLKQFAEVETLLMKECEQVERARQRLAAERARMVSARFGQVGPAAAPSDNNNNNNILNTNNSNRQPIIPSPASQTNMPAYGNSQPTHPHMSFMPRQPMFPFGPRLPLSAIHPTTSAPSTSNVMFASATANAAGLGHAMLRPVSGTNTNVG